MKYCIFTSEGNGLPIALRLQEEGHDVIVGQVIDNTTILTRLEKREAYIEDSEEKRLRLLCYQNMVELMPADKLIEKLKKVKNPKEYFIFFDINYLFSYADQLRNLGFHGNFPTQEDRLFEMDRDKAKEFVKQHYPLLRVAPKKQFYSITATKNFLKKDKKNIWVLKSQNYGAPVLVPETDDPFTATAQIIETLEEFPEYYEGSGMFLELKIPNLIEIAVEKIYYDGIAVGTCFDLENKFLGSGNLGYQVGCAGDLNFPIPMNSKILSIAFPPIVDKLAKEHKGLFFWDAALLINDQTRDIYFCEYCPNRPRYNMIFSYFSQMPSVNYFFETITKQKSPFILGNIAASVSLFNLSQDMKGNLLSNASITIKDYAKKNIWLYDAYKKSPDDIIRSTGYDIYLAPVTGAGKSIQEATNNVYANIKGISMRNLYYRPQFDFLSRDYSSSILNRLDYAIENDFFKVPFT